VTATPGSVPDRQDNGLVAAAYVPLTDVVPQLVSALLTALARARIPAYVASTPSDEALRLFVAAEERADARTIVASVVRAAGQATPPDRNDPLAGIDTDAEFERLIADWHVDTHHAIRDAERALTAEDEEWRARLEKDPAADEPVWLDDDHYVPPAPPPLPRFAPQTVLALIVIALSVLLLAFGGELGVASRLTLILGICGVLLGAGILVSRLRDRGDDDDDGARI
jgi:hypothetical protein